jgi:hypothetical protein
MSTQPHRRRFAQRLQGFGHYAVGLAVLMKGWWKLEHPHGYGLVIAIAFGGGAAIILGNALHRRLERHLHPFEAFIFAVEAVVAGLIGLADLQRERRLIHYCWLAIAVAFAARTLVILIKHRRRAAKSAAVPSAEPPADHAGS